MGKKRFKASSYFFKDYLIILFGTFTYSLGITQFIMPHEFVTGGVPGISILLNYATQIPISVTILVVNTALIIIAWRILGAHFLFKTIVGVGFITLFLAFFEYMNFEPIMTNEPIIAGLVGAILCGIGIGFVFSVNGSMGGTDIIIMIINTYRNFTPGRLMLMIDLIIVTSSFLIFKSIETIVFGIIIIAVITTVVDYVINGVRQSVQLFIFSQEYERIATGINAELGRGCTILNGMGWYSKNPINVIVVMAKRTESVTIFRLVKTIDPNAFISQSSVIGVYGEGFDKIKL